MTLLMMSLNSHITAFNVLVFKKAIVSPNIKANTKDVVTSIIGGMGNVK